MFGAWRKKRVRVRSTIDIDIRESKIGQELPSSLNCFAISLIETHYCDGRDRLSDVQMVGLHPRAILGRKVKATDHLRCVVLRQSGPSSGVEECIYSC